MLGDSPTQARPVSLRAALALLASLAAAAPVDAQSARTYSDWPSVGERVRVRTADGGVTGTLERTDSGAIGIRIGGAATVTNVPVAAIDRLWVARGERALTRRGALIGALAGVVAIGILGSVKEGPNATDPGQGWVLGVAFGAPLGLVVGASIGAAARGDRWEVVGVPGGG